MNINPWEPKSEVPTGMDWWSHEVISKEKFIEKKSNAELIQTALEKMEQGKWMMSVVTCKPFTIKDGYFISDTGVKFSSMLLREIRGRWVEMKEEEEPMLEE